MLERHRWTCLACGETVENYSKLALNTLIRLHEAQHEIDRLKNIRKFDEIKLSAPRKNYDILRISRLDIGFLKTRGIRIDEDMELVEDGRDKIQRTKS